MKAMGIMYHSIKKNRGLPLPPPQSWSETVAGLRHGVRVEVAHHLLDPHHQGGDSVVRGFNDM